MVNHFKIFCLLFVFVLSFNTGAAQSKNKNDKKDAITAKYDAAGPFCNGLARVRKEMKWGFVDTLGRVVIPLKYNQVENFSDGIAKVRKGQKWGIVDVTGKELRKPTFDAIGEFINGVAKVLLNGEEYYMNTDGMRVDVNGKPVVGP